MTFHLLTSDQLVNKLVAGNFIEQVSLSHKLNFIILFPGN